MGITIIRKTPPPPPDSPLLAALQQVGKRPETLMLIHRETGEGYRVLEHDPITGYTVLKNNQGARLRPIIRTNEDALYYPMWR
jgi:hypothetical protein